MTTTYDPTHPRYDNEDDMRGELLRVYDLCHGCRLCFNLCPSFPSLFEAIDAHDGNVEALSVAEQDKVVDECYQCKLCYVKCPYVPPHEWELDFPRLMLRNTVVRRKDDGLRAKLTDQALGRTDLVGTLSTMVAPLANAVTQTPGSLPRRVMEKVTGIAAERMLPPYARQRFSTWFKKRVTPTLTRRQGSVTVFPTCLVEYQNPAIGKDLVAVYERNGVACSLPEGAGCCGAPFLHAGDFDSFLRQAGKNVPILAAEVRAGRDIVVPQPTCGYVLKKDYPDYVGGPDAALIGANTYDAAEYLMKLHKGEDTELDTSFDGSVPESISYHVSCHLQAQNIGLKSRDLMKLTGTTIKLVNKCSGIDGTWGYRTENYELARMVAQPLATAIEDHDCEVVAGDCHLANGAIEQETARRALHPLQVMARAYGIAEETTTS
ncbi:MAG: heterodisulfide reductase-related iron-sulfur binding cluster [Acidimicrobiales bacterium]